MKTIFLIPLLSYFSFINICQAQTDTTSKTKSTFLTLSTGINSNTGFIGVQLEQKVVSHFALYAGGGIGTWGYKLTGGARYYFTHPLGSAIGVSYSYATGVKNVKSSLPVTNNNTGAQTTESVTLDLKPVSAINITYLRYWKMGRTSRFNLEVGYSIPLSTNFENNYTVKSPTDVTLTSTSKQSMRIIQPGGILIGIGFNFGL